MGWMRMGLQGLIGLEENYSCVNYENEGGLTTQSDVTRPI
jgi:hypothetical protein